MIEIVKGNLLDAKADAICQQVNCQNKMGAGLAKAIYTRWPIVKTEYHIFCEQFKDPYSLLGKLCVVKARPGQPFDIVNVFGQLNYGRDNVCYTDYDALRNAFNLLQLKYIGRTIAFPYNFGCGLAGGNWNVVYNLIDYQLTGVKVLLYQND